MKFHHDDSEKWFIQSPKGSDTHNKWDAGVRLGDSEIRSAFCKVETGEKVAITVNCLHPILLDDEFRKKNVDEN